MASLFGKNKLREIANKLQTSELENEIALVKTWHNDYHNGSLKADKETSREQAYNQDFFIKILGYKEKPAVPYSFEPKATTDKGQLPDAVLSHTDAPNDIKHIAAVVELKGASIELDRPQRREGNMSPVQQGFKYKTQYRNCPFVIVSNFWEFRLYHDNQLDYELWTLDDLVDPADDYLKFKTFYTLLHSDNLTTPKGASKTEGWLSDIRFEQEEISKKFYKVYREARLELLRDIYQHNDVVRKNIDLGIEKAQKIIDRIVFACFAEDRGLLPDDTLRRVVHSADSSSFGGSLWFTFKSFFEAIDVGSDKLEIPDGYNGGLFAYDQELNALKISDEPLRKVASISNYNFVEDLSVTILGHIFEQSISDLEEIKSKVEDSQDIESLQQSRRKKDGIFYTPDYIVRYIVDNSLGTYLRDEEERLKTEFKLKGDITDKNYEKRERQAYGQYQDFLQNVKVVDPACGSGAFLVYVFDYLLAENQRVASILGNNLFSSEDYVKTILKNNIYGVDLNDESVEITKLSLWLKSAQKGKKLTTLDSNIKCGNSLVDDPEIAGPKAFDWNKEFADVFKQGGFDVVVGNPPYVVYIRSQVGQQTIDYVNNRYSYAEYNPNTYAMFVDLALNILTTNSGYIGYIIPNTWLTGRYFSRMRDNLYQKQVNEIVYLKNTAFKEVVETLIILVQNKLRSNKILRLSTEASRSSGKDIQFEFNKYQQGFNPFVAEATGLIEKLERMPKLKESAIVYRGIETRNNSVYISQDKASELHMPILLGRDVNRYSTSYSGSYLKFIKSEMKSNANELMYLQPKVLMRRTGVSIISDIDETGMFALKNLYLLLPKEGMDIFTIQAVLASRLMEYYHFSKMGNENKAFAQFQANYVEDLPFVRNGYAPFRQLVLQQRGLTAERYEISQRLQKLLMSEYNLSKWPAKLMAWWSIDSHELIKTLKLNLSLQQKDELLQLLDKYRNECALLNDQISEADVRINQVVYKLFNLSPEEIIIVESHS